uniref:Monocyte to macrophage differentiation factor 2 n=2 Tax=Stichopus japonicus TaxID=307972 RepID=S5M1D8_STIJA|nr:monocyte to macrophage differentiation factor 2 [Apostichopus japonicus]
MRSSKMERRKKGTWFYNLRVSNEPAIGNAAYVPAKIEHVANSVTHAFFILPSITAGYGMIKEACNPIERSNAVLFTVALVTLFSVSTCFHTLCLCGQAGKLRFYFHMTDRAVIYLFIAASYTPWLTIMPVGFFGFHLRWLMWFGALLGITYSYCFYEKNKRLETILYLILAVAPSLAVLEVPGMDGSYELAFGGLVYLLGVLFFKSDGIVPFAHAIWHLFVVGGAFIHQYAIQEYLIGPLNFTKAGEIIHNATCASRS